MRVGACVSLKDHGGWRRNACPWGQRWSIAGMAPRSVPGRTLGSRSISGTPPAHQGGQLTDRVISTQACVKLALSEDSETQLTNDATILRLPWAKVGRVAKFGVVG